ALWTRRTRARRTTHPAALKHRLPLRSPAARGSNRSPRQRPTLHSACVESRLLLHGVLRGSPAYAWSCYPPLSWGGGRRGSLLFQISPNSRGIAQAGGSAGGTGERDNP